MASEVQICKLALARIGADYQIASLSEASAAAQACNLLYEPARDSMLREHPWNFATKYVAPATLTGTVPGRWDFMYAYPSDCVRVLEIMIPVDAAPGTTEIPFEVGINEDDAKVIMTDQDEATIKYSKRVTDPNQFDPQFVTALSYRLAAELAVILTDDPRIQSNMETLYRNVVLSTWETDSNEGLADPAQTVDWLDVRG